MVGLGVLAAGTYALCRAVEATWGADDLGWQTPRFPFPPQPSAPTGPAPPGPADGDGPAPWVAPAGPACPASHPIKAKLTSGIYHPPAGASYDRTVPDRCYRDPRQPPPTACRAAKR